MEIVDDHVVLSIGRDLAAADIAAHGDVEEDGEVLDRPLALHCHLHDRLAVDVPHQPAVAGLPTGLVPGKVVPHRPGAHVVDLGLEDAVLLRLMMVTPVETGFVLVVAVPGLGDVNLAIVGPGERLLGEQPEGRPDAVGTGGLDHTREDASVATQRPLADETSGCEALLGLMRAAICDGPEDQAIVLRAGMDVRIQFIHSSGRAGDDSRHLLEGICRISAVMLHLLIAPSIIAIADLELPLVIDQSGGLEYRLPVWLRLVGRLLGCVLEGLGCQIVPLMF